jgi:hypothetical protein
VLGQDWIWYGDRSISTNEDYQFGFYGYWARDWDDISYNAPYYLIVKAAGNDRNEGPPSLLVSQYVWDWNFGEGDWVLSSDLPPPDGGTTGYDTITDDGTAKNILTVGNAGDIPGGYNSPSDVLVSYSSNWGPTDDGRIKPDICGNGQALFSAWGSGDDNYRSSSGTSMASPNVAGSLLLLQQLYQEVNHLFGDPMRSATLKGLAIHTADEAGPDPGPDYSSEDCCQDEKSSQGNTQGPSCRFGAWGVSS